jgi:hypothetical protein
MVIEDGQEESDATLVEASVLEGLRTAAFGMFALEQALPLGDLRPLAAGVPLIAQGSRSPDWFSAAASEHASLLDTAPELVALDGRDSGSSADAQIRADADIIGMYAPEAPAYLRPLVGGVELEFEPEVLEAASEAGLTPRTSVQLGLLRELSDLDS